MTQTATMDLDVVDRLQEMEDAIDALQQDNAKLIANNNATNKAYQELELIVKSNQTVLQQAVGTLLSHLDAHAQHAPLSASGRLAATGKPSIIVPE